MISSNKFFTLIKYFGKKKYAELFMRGKIYMNYLGYFWDPLNGYAEQHDIHEGIVLATNRSQIDGVLGEYLVCDPMFRAEGYKYCNLACFYRIDIEAFPVQNRNFLLHWQDYANMKEFGEWVVIIKDVDELMRRVDEAVQIEKFKYCAGDVSYYRDIKPDVHSMILQADLPIDLHNMSDGQKFDSFYKTYKYQNQKEWRISLYRGLKEECSYTLNVGNLDDIACLTNIQDMSDHFSMLLSSHSVRPNWDYYYRGNVTRDELRDLFIALGDYQAKMSLTVKIDAISKLPPAKKGDFLERFRRRVKDVIDNFVERTITEEEFSLEIDRLWSVLESSRISFPNTSLPCKSSSE